jgi:hypothetical protein
MRCPEACSVAGDCMCMSKMGKVFVWLVIVAISAMSCYFIKYSPDPVDPPATLPYELESDSTTCVSPKG